MKAINEILKQKGVKSFANDCERQLIEAGFVYSDWYGWEKPENLLRFGINPNGTGVPAMQYEETDYKEKFAQGKDRFGKPTGEKIVEKIPYNTGKLVWGVTQGWLDYKKWKEDEEKKNYAIRINTPNNDYLQA